MCTKFCLGAFILLIIAFVVFITIVCVKYRKAILRYIIKHHIIRFLANILFPFALPFVLTFAIEKGIHFSEYSKLQKGVLIVLVVAAIINLVVQFLIWNKERREANLKWENAAANYSNNSLYEIYMDKCIQMRAAYHNGLRDGMLSDADVPYNIFEHIRKITWQFCCAISQITNIPTKDLEAEFVYRYTFKGAKGDNIKWRWITGKGSKFNLSLPDFFEVNDSAFHYLANNNVSTILCNDKIQAANEQKYHMTYKDHSHNRIGSFVAAKIAFSSNDQMLCEGIIYVASFGKRFLDDSPEYTEDEFKHLILDSIFPCYRQLLTAELAMLYFRHYEDADDNKTNDKKKIIKSITPYYKKYKKTTECFIGTNRRYWKNSKGGDKS